MSSTFIERNKKKSLLAALLLFFRRRKELALLLLLVLLGTAFVVGPSSLLTSLPGGARLAAGVAWVAQKAGVDVSRWGLGTSRRSFGELLAAFQAAKEAPGGAGWGAFFSGRRGGAGADAGAAAGRGSLDFVKGGDVGSRGVKGIASRGAGPSGRGSVAVPEGGPGGEREGLVKDAFAGGFREGAGGGGGGAAPGGAYAGRGFFNGETSAASGRATSRLASAGMAGAASVTAPKTSIVGASKSRLSTQAANALKMKSQKGLMKSTLDNNTALVQLAEGSAVATEVTSPGCTNCSTEFASKVTGANYDGTTTTGDVLGDTPADLSAVDAALTDAAVEAQQMADCMTAYQQCQTDQQPYLDQLSVSQTKIADLKAQQANACTDPCNCDPCHNLENQINTVCADEVTPAVNGLNAPCSIPTYCADLGITSPSTGSAGAAQNLCANNSMECADCPDVWCDVSCWGENNGWW